MGNPIVSSDFVRLLDNRLRKVFEGEFKELSPMIDTLYNRMPSDSAWEEFFEVGSLGDIPEFNGKVSYLSISPGYYTRIEPKEYAGGLQFERKLLADKKYNVLDGRASELSNSARRTMDKIAVRPFAYAFSSAFDFQYSEEGLSMCNSAHTTKVPGVSVSSGFSNSGTTAFSKTALAATRLLMRRFRDDSGNRIEIEPDTILVPDNLYESVLEATGYDPRSGAASQLDPASANGMINTQYKRWKVIPYLRLDDYDTNNWFMIDSKLMKKFLIWIDREKPSVNNTMDFDTFIWKFNIYFRIACGFLNWRFLYGHNVS